MQQLLTNSSFLLIIHLSTLFCSCGKVDALSFNNHSSEGFIVKYTLITANSPDCDPSLSDNYPVRVQYKLRSDENDRSRARSSPSDATIWRETPFVPTPIRGTGCANNFVTLSNNVIAVTQRSYQVLILSTDVDLDNVDFASQRIQLRLVQSDHRGGFCDCWAVTHLFITSMSESSTCDVLLSPTCARIGRNYTGLTNFLGNFGVNINEMISCNSSEHPISNQTSSLGFCRGSASVPRGFVSVEVGASKGSQCDSDVAVVDAGKYAPMLGDMCDSLPHVDVKFDLSFPNRRIDSFDEGVEFAFRNLHISQNWIPLVFCTSRRQSLRDQNISIGEVNRDDNMLYNFRGYNVSFIIISQVCKVHLKVCVSGVIQDESVLNFRWLQTVKGIAVENLDETFLDNVQVSINFFPQHSVVFMDDFDGQESINSTRWANVHHVSLENDQLQFGRTAPTFTSPDITDRRGTPTTIISRGISTTNLTYPTFQTKLIYTLITTNTPDCVNSGTFMSPFPQLQYRYGSSKMPWVDIEPVDVSVVSKDSCISVTNAIISNVANGTASEPFHFRFVQQEHHGGFCDCWAIANLTLIHVPTFYSSSVIALNYSKLCGVDIKEKNFFYSAAVTTEAIEDIDIVAGFCEDSASVPRQFVAQFGTTATQCDKSAIKDPPTDCGDSIMKIEVTFELEFVFNSSECKGTDDINEGIELSFRSIVEDNPREWIPLLYSTKQSDPSLPTFIELLPGSIINETSNITGSFTLRGYRVPYYIIETENKHYFNLSICGEEIFENPLQLRWLQTSYQESDSVGDVVSLDNVIVRLQNATSSTVLLEDCFDSQTSINFTLWDINSTYSVNVINSLTSNVGCKPSKGGALFFRFQPLPSIFHSNDGVNYTINSRRLVTNPLNPSNIDIFRSTSESCTRLLSGSPNRISSLEVITSTRIIANDKYRQILDMIQNRSILSALTELQVLLNLQVTKEVDETATTYLLSAVVDQLGKQIVEPAISEKFLSVASSLLDVSLSTARISKDITPLEKNDGSTLLQIMDRFALNNYNASQMVTSENIELFVEELVVNDIANGDERISLIQEESAEINIPIREVLASARNREVRMASVLFRNMSGLLPVQLEGANISKVLVSRLASPVISVSFHSECDTCTTSNLSAPILVTFQHLPYDQSLLNNDQNASVQCVFWKFNESDINRPGAILFSGQWSREGCETNFTPTMTVCKCNHLTHFAILLSTQPLLLSHPQILSLQIIGYIGVSVSLIGMAATVCVMVFLNCNVKRPLQIMRNCVHTQLCVSLSIAQVIFVAGVEPRLEEGQLVGGVPVGCRLVAVLLHYWFLVSFMWMLMEGVVLYVALVRVFVTYHRRYIATFTISSYGLPLLYVGGLTVPLGFARNNDIRKNHAYDYGYEQACYLNPVTSFIWTLIAPVILIFLANIGFFIMTFVIKYRHQKAEDTQNVVKRIGGWLKVSVSLTVLMGITWIIGLLMIEVQELFFLAYIFTIFVAFQGLFIFVVIVLMDSNQVKEVFTKWWKSKIAASEFLSRHFGENSHTHGIEVELVQQSVSMSSRQKNKTNDVIQSVVAINPLAMHDNVDTKNRRDIHETTNFDTSTSSVVGSEELYST